jgi:hypothetical protein
MAVEPHVQQAHAMLPAVTSEERSRQEFVKSLKFHLATRVAPGNRDVLRASGVPAVTPAQVALDAFEPDAAAAAEREAWRKRFLDVVLRVVHQDQEELSRAASAMPYEAAVQFVEQPVAEP